MLINIKASRWLLLLPVLSFAATIVVSNGDNLQAKIDGASGGDTVLVNNGTYGGFQIQNRTFTEARPLIIKAAPGARPLITSGNWYLTPISGSSYIAFDGFILDGSGQPLYCTDVDHLILINLEVRNSGQEMIHIRGTSRYVDIINCHIHHSGSAQPQWAEGIYIGSGSTPFMNEEYVWIEGNEIYNTGNSEAINIKSQSYHITIRNNVIHDIYPGTATQYNQSALSLEALDYAFKPGVDPDIWIEDNEIYNVKYGQWANGMQLTSMGSRVKGNHIHDCEQNCIFFNNYNAGASPFTNYLYNNTLEGCAQGNYNTTSTLPISWTDPGTNPNRPQDWYKSMSVERQSPGRRDPTARNTGIQAYRIYNLKGRLVRAGKGTANAPGREWEAGLPNGIYIVRESGNPAAVKKVLLK